MKQPRFKYYTGTKTVKASEMRADDARLNGAQITFETIKANAGKDGYLVEYPDGYRSWSPKTTFDESYKLSESHLDRLRIELSQLETRYIKLQEFLFTDKYHTLDAQEKLDLEVQVDIMRKYIYVLQSRINRAEQSITSTSKNEDHAEKN